MDYTITERQAREAGMAAYAASDLVAHLAQLSDAPWLSAGQAELRAEWAFEAFDKLAACMAHIPRPAPIIAVTPIPGAPGGEVSPHSGPAGGTETRRMNE